MLAAHRPERPPHFTDSTGTMNAPSDTDLQYLRDAIQLSELAVKRGNMPYGAVLVAADGEVLARAENTIVHDSDPTAHAETNAIRIAAKTVPTRRFAGATMYASGEPCPMCSGAMMRMGFKRVLFGIRSAKAMPYMPVTAGAMPGTVPCRDMLSLAPQGIEVHGPLLEDEAEAPFMILKARSG